MNIPSPSGLIWTLHELFVSFDMMTRDADDERMVTTARLSYL